MAKYSFWQTKSPFLLILYYTVGIGLIWISGHIAPTNLAGPGLDMLALLILAIIFFILFLISFFKVLKKDKSFVVPLIIHILIFVAFIATFYFETSRQPS